MGPADGNASCEHNLLEHLGLLLLVWAKRLQAQVGHTCILQLNGKQVLLHVHHLQRALQQDGGCSRWSYGMWDEEQVFGCTLRGMSRSMKRRFSERQFSVCAEEEKKLQLQKELDERCQSQSEISLPAIDRKFCQDVSLRALWLSCTHPGRCDAGNWRSWRASKKRCCKRRKCMWFLHPVIYISADQAINWKNGWAKERDRTVHLLSEPQQSFADDDNHGNGNNGGW